MRILATTILTFIAMFLVACAIYFIDDQQKDTELIGYLGYLAFINIAPVVFISICIFQAIRKITIINNDLLTLLVRITVLFVLYFITLILFFYGSVVHGPLSLLVLAALFISTLIASIDMLLPLRKPT